jgi:hypothetical protein
MKAKMSNKAKRNKLNNKDRKYNQEDSQLTQIIFTSCLYQPTLIHLSLLKAARAQDKKKKWKSLK